MSKTNAVRLLDKAKIDYRLVNYQYDAENLDVAKIAQDNDLALAQVYKTLVCKGDKTGPLVAVVPGDCQLSLKALAKQSGNKKIALLALSELTKTTGYMRGGCSPLGMKKNYAVYIAEQALDWDEILINAGARGVLFATNPKMLIDVFGFNVVNISL